MTDYTQLHSTWSETYWIQVTDESGRKTVMDTGVTKWYKRGAPLLWNTLDYYRECNPTKQFKLL